MKRIILLLVTLLSFSAKADMQELWKQTDGNFRTTAFCVFANSKTNDGHIYLYVRFVLEHNITVEPLMENKVARSLDMSLGIQNCKRKIEVED